MSIQNASFVTLTDLLPQGNNFFALFSHSLPSPMVKNIQNWDTRSFGLSDTLRMTMKLMPVALYGKSSISFLGLSLKTHPLTMIWSHVSTARRTNHTLFKLRTRLSRVLLASLWIFFRQWSFWAQRFPCQICGPWNPLNQDTGICPSRIFGCPTHFFSGNFTYLLGYNL